MGVAQCVQDELEAELEELEDEDLNEELPAPMTKTPKTPQPVSTAAPIATRPAPASINEENDELKALQKEMALWKSELRAMQF